MTRADGNGRPESERDGRQEWSQARFGSKRWETGKTSQEGRNGKPPKSWGLGSRACLSIALASLPGWSVHGWLVPASPWLLLRHHLWLLALPRLACACWS